MKNLNLKFNVTILLLIHSIHIAAQLNSTQEVALNKLLEKKDIQGLSLSIVKNNEVVYSKGFGNANNETLFQAASLSKLPIAILFLINSTNKNVDLNQGVNIYLKDYKLKGHKSNPSKIPTSYQLITHTGGTNIGGFLGYKKDRGKVPSIDNILHGKYTYFWEPPIKVKRQVNGQYDYSGGGYCILQKIMEDVKDNLFENIIWQEILKPLNMESSFYDFHPPKDSNIALGHTRKGKLIKGGYRLYPQKAAAGLWTNSLDYAKILIAILEGFRENENSFLSKALVELMIKPTKTIDGRVNNYGLGVVLSINENNIVESIFHGGQNFGYTSFFYLDILRNQGYVIFTNKNRAKLDEIKWLLEESFK